MSPIFKSPWVKIVLIAVGALLIFAIFRPLFLSNRTGGAGDVERAAAMARSSSVAVKHKGERPPPYLPPECVGNNRCSGTKGLFDEPLLPISLGVGVLLVAGLIWFKRAKSHPKFVPSGPPPVGPTDRPIVDPFLRDHYEGYEPRTADPLGSTAAEDEAAKKNGLVLGEARHVERGTYTILVRLGMGAQSKSPVQCASLKFRLLRKPVGDESSEEIDVEMRGLRVDGLIRDGDRVAISEKDLMRGRIARPQEIFNRATNSSITRVPEPGGNGGAGASLWTAIAFIVFLSAFVLLAVAMLKHR